MTINWIQVLRLTSLLAAANSSGYGLCSDRVAVHNALLSSNEDTMIREWFRAWDFGRKYGPFAVTGSGLGFLGVALLDGPKNPCFFLDFGAAFSMGLVVLYTVFVVFPVNDQLLDAHSRFVSQKKFDLVVHPGPNVRHLVAAWKRLDIERTLLSTFAALLGLIAACMD